uniref:Preprotein translocase SecG subunit n=1 Tax=Ditylenchus dipsaci TaxID=166011 RepID=A0A915CW61_9BILA
MRYEITVTRLLKISLGTNFLNQSLQLPDKQPEIIRNGGTGQAALLPSFVTQVLLGVSSLVIITNGEASKKNKH